MDARPGHGGEDDSTSERGTAPQFRRGFGHFDSFTRGMRAGSVQIEFEVFRSWPVAKAGFSRLVYAHRQGVCFCGAG